MISDLDIQKWNFKTHEYEPYSVPSDALVYLWTDNMESLIDCASCFRHMMTYGASFTSRTLHNSIGVGYPVCGECYAAEFKSEEQAKHEL